MASPRSVSRPFAHGDTVRSTEPADLAYVIETRSGERRQVGNGRPAFVLRVPSFAAWQHLAQGSVYRAATAFVHGEFDVDGDMVAALRWWRSHTRRPASWVIKAAAGLRLESLFQTRLRARTNIEFHYDRSNEFYQQFLDRRMVYSEAYFADPSASLDEAQLAKLHYIVRKLDLRAGERFLDIGCGWGALVMHAAESAGAAATGCTVSARQFAFVQRELATRGLGSRVHVVNADYRTLEGEFDKIASIGMYEHVGRRRLEDYFRTIGRLLAPGGLVLNSGIARPEPTGDDAETLFVQRFVFPGGELPHLSEVIGAAERAGLEVLDVESQRRHYGLTCAAWVARLQANRERCLAIVDEATWRTWVLYLAGSAVAFERGDIELFHVLLGKPGGRRRPITRDYMYR